MSTNQRGDTIIEVLFAITVFSIIGVASLTLMNQGTATVQRSLEISHVRNEIDAQADGLRYIHDSYVNSVHSGAASGGSLWETITDPARLKTNNIASAFDTMTNFEVCGGESANKLDPRAFALNLSDLNKPAGKPLLTTFVRAASYAKIRSDMSVPQSDGLWIEAVKGTSLLSGITPAYYDFHIRACWNAPGQSVPMTLGTIVRLYEP